MPGSGDRRDRNVIAVIGKADAVTHIKACTAATTALSLIPEARYAYYRRCQRFRRNGEQCKAPAMKGEAICYRHAEQADNEARRVWQRRELLATPGLGFGSFRAVQRTLGAVAQALLDDRIDRKTAGRLAIELQTASKLLWQQHLLSRKNPFNFREHGGTQKEEELEQMQDSTGLRKSPVETRRRRVFVCVTLNRNGKQRHDTNIFVADGSARVIPREWTRKTRKL